MIGLHWALMVIVVISFITIMPSIYALEADSIPLVKVQKLPTEMDFQDKTKEQLLGDTWHATFIRENGEKIDTYFLHTGKNPNEGVAIFYFEDTTPDNFKTDEKYIWKSDFFLIDIILDRTTNPNVAASVYRFGNDCVRPIDENTQSYFEQANCSLGAVITKKTDNGWAAFVKTFGDFPLPKDGFYQIKWTYVDTRLADDNYKDNSVFTSYPTSFSSYGEIREKSYADPGKIIVNYGNIPTNNFLYTPTENIISDITPNSISCAQGIIDITSKKENYDKDENAVFTVNLEVDYGDQTIWFRVFDENDDEVAEYSNNINGKKAIFQFPLNDFDSGVYKGVVEYGVNGPQGSIKFAIESSKIFEQEVISCDVYLLYQQSGKKLDVFARIYDTSGLELDSFQIFVDRDGDGGITIDADDIRYNIDKNNVGGYVLTGSEGWYSHEDLIKTGKGKINKLNDGWEILVEVPNVSKNFRIAFEQNDHTLWEFEKRQFPDNSYSTIPDSWAIADFSGQTKSSLKSDKWIPAEMMLNQKLDVNLILVGDTWSESYKNQIKSKLTKSFTPIVLMETHLAGIEYDYSYNFVSASEQESQELFDFMKENSKRMNPFYGENYDNPYGIGNWIMYNHTEWTSVGFERFEVDYRLINAEMMEDHIYENIISKKLSLDKSNAVNLIFIADDMEKVDFLHNYSLFKYDPARNEPHEVVGLMGHGGKYNFYFFDLYAVPWDPIQGYQGYYDENLINEYTNFHDFPEEQRPALLTNYINNATSLILTPSYIYSPVYKENYHIDLVIATEPSSTAFVTTIDNFINTEKIISELENILPYSSWTIDISLEKFDSRELPKDLKNVINTRDQYFILEDNALTTFDVVDSDKLTEVVVKWAGTRQSSDFRDFTDIEKSDLIIPVLLIINDEEIYIDQPYVNGFAPSNPDDETQPCCALAVTSDNAVWDAKVGVTDLVIHEVGHVIGLMHPFQGFTDELQFMSNDYFNWYGSVMAYNTAPYGCTNWYTPSCGNADRGFTVFEKEHIAKGTTAFLIKASKNNIYRTVLELENSGKDVTKLPEDIKQKINNIQRNVEQAENHFKRNSLDKSNGSIYYALLAARESEKLANQFLIEYKTPEVTLKTEIPSWIKDQAKWWITNSISNEEFVNAIQYLIKEKIIVIPPVTEESSQTIQGSKIPEWVKTNVKWWTEDKITDDELVSAFQHLIKIGIIRI